MSVPAQTTQLLNRLSDGDPAASAPLWQAIHAELHQLAESHMAREDPAHTLQPTALVHEAWLKLIDASSASWKSRGHFYAMASRVMRSILVDHARAKKTEKRGGRQARVPLEEQAGQPSGSEDVDVLALHEALEQLEAVDAERAQLLELRYFGGLSIAEISHTTGTAERTVERRLAAATGWVRERMLDHE